MTRRTHSLSYGERPFQRTLTDRAQTALVPLSASTIRGHRRVHPGTLWGSFCLSFPARMAVGTTLWLKFAGWSTS